MLEDLLKRKPNKDIFCMGHVDHGKATFDCIRNSSVADKEGRHHSKHWCLSSINKTESHVY